MIQPIPPRPPVELRLARDHYPAEPPVIVPPPVPTMSETNTKPASRSLTIQSATISAVAMVLNLLLPLVGLDVSTAEIVEILTAVVALIGAVGAIVGRLRASVRIG
jgi:hypothetical protein